VALPPVDWAQPARRLAAESSRKSYEESLKRAGFDAITTEIVDAPEFYYTEDYHQQYLAKNPGGYCRLGGCGVSFESAVG
jgi:peptide-methionine (S)-S-oxide reductase